VPNKARLNTPLSKQFQSTTLQTQRANYQSRTLNSLPVLPRSQQQQSRQNIKTKSVATKGCQHKKHYHFFSNNNSKQHHHTLFGSNNNNYYSSKMDRSIINCEKFLPDQDLTKSTKENDLLLIQARQSNRFV